MLNVNYIEKRPIPEIEVEKAINQLNESSIETFALTPGEENNK